MAESIDAKVARLMDLIERSNNPFSLINRATVEAALRTELAVQGEPQVCCGNPAQCLRPCTPRGEWLARHPAAQAEPVSPLRFTVAQADRSKFAYVLDGWGLTSAERFDTSKDSGREQANMRARFLNQTSTQVVAPIAQNTPPPVAGNAKEPTGAQLAQYLRDRACGGSNYNRALNQAADFLEGAI